MEKATHPQRLDHSRYVDHLQKWEQYFSDDQIFIGFFEEINKQPNDFLKKLFKFLDLPVIDHSVFDKLVHKKVNANSTTIPVKVLTAIAQSEYGNIIKTHQRFNNQYTATWVNEVEKILGMKSKTN